jgi:hypothetical protein
MLRTREDLAWRLDCQPWIGRRKRERDERRDSLAGDRAPPSLGGDLAAAAR